MTLLATVGFPCDGPGPDPAAAAFARESLLHSVRQAFADVGELRPAVSRAEAMAMDEVERLLQQAGNLGAAGTAARRAGEEKKAGDCFRQALTLTRDAADRLAARGSAAARQDVLHRGVRHALDCGEAGEARRLMAVAERARGSTIATEEWGQFHDEHAWSDIWLVAAVRRDPPDEKALDVLADRYWKPLFGRCQVLTLNHHRASDLAQEAWCRVLRMRHALNPGGNFPAYLTAVATNLWRDWHRSARRAGPMAEHQLTSLDAVWEAGEGNVTSLVDILPDLNGLEAEQRKLLMTDIDQALARLAPQMRDVLVARFLGDESCAEIGRRYGRTEQSVSGWIRQAVQEMKGFLAESGCATLRKAPHD